MLLGENLRSKLALIAPKSGLREYPERLVKSLAARALATAQLDSS